MKKLNPGHIVKIATICIVIVFVLVAIFLSQLKSEILQLIAVYGYIASFILTLLLESLAQPIGPEVPLAAGRLLGLNMVAAASITIAGSLIASLVNYRVGKVFQNLKVDKKHLKYVKWYKKHGKYGLLIAALGPVPYVPFCWFSGSFGLSMKNFVYPKINASPYSWTILIS